jgi:ADP-ribose pyrophosphatase YjhB (NUDIX family)
MVVSSESGSTLVVQGNRFLLVNAKVGRSKGLWNNPGGHLEPNESPAQAAARETFEETGFVVRTGRLIGTYRFAHDGGFSVKYVFEGTIESGSLHVPPSEIAQAKWFSLDELRNESSFTEGAVRSARDFFAGKFNQSYECGRVP